MKMTEYYIVNLQEWYITSVYVFYEGCLLLLSTILYGLWVKYVSIFKETAWKRRSSECKNLKAQQLNVWFLGHF